MGMPDGKFYNWRQRYGKVNEHNGWIPRDHWLEELGEARHSRTSTGSIRWKATAV